MSLTERQKHILMAIIREFMHSAEEVGSSYLVENYDLGVSSATIRNEMVRLMEKGYLNKNHVSSGRVPTDQAIRMYVQEISGDDSLQSIEAAEIRQGIFKVRFSQNQLVKEVLNTLSTTANAAAFIVMDDTSRYYGVSSLMKYEEMRDIHVMQRVLDLLEDENLLKQVFSKYDGDEVSLLIGKETGIKDMDECALLFTRFNFFRGQSGHMGVIGSRRLDYSKAIPAVKVVRDSVENSLRGWR